MVAPGAGTGQPGARGEVSGISLLSPTGASILSDGIASLRARISGTRGVGVGVGVGDGVAVSVGVGVVEVALGVVAGVSILGGSLAAHATAVVSRSAQQSQWT